MWFAKFDRRPIRSRAFGVSIVGTLAVATVLVTHPAVYAAALSTLASVVTCASSSACVAGTNSSSGPGVSGTSSSGYGVYGISKSNDGIKAVSTSSNGVSASSTSLYGIKGVSSSSYGVYGSTSSGPAAILGTSASSSTGVEGTSSDGIGVQGISNGNDDGLSGISYGSGSGVFGYSAGGTGIYGTTESNSGIGVYGLANGAGTGLYGLSGSGDGLYANSTSGYGLQAHTSSGADALTAFNDGGNGSDIRGTYIGMIGRAPATNGYPIVLTDSAGNDVFYVDGAGNVSYTGQLQSLSRSRSGGAVQSYSATTTQPVVEDFGTAQLTGGAASVMLDATFAGSIDMHTPYRVFITPNGDTRGLFVATKTARGFLVRESQGGHSTVTFDYRIVATAPGQLGKRMVPMSTAGLPRAGANVLSPPASKPPVQQGPTQRK